MIRSKRFLSGRIRHGGMRLALVAGALCAALAASPLAHSAVGRTAGALEVSPAGEATYSVPLFAPQGSGKLTPSLKLTYGHRTSGSWLGAGWGVAGLSAITRCPKTWAQDGISRDVKLDLTDRYCLDGAQLRLFTGTYGANGATYRTEIEQWAYIESTDVAGVFNGPGYFTVKTKDGLIYEYGNSQTSRIEAMGLPIVSVWALNAIRDRSGNRIDFTYIEDATNGGYQIDRVDWTSNASQGISAAYRMQFMYATQPSAEIENGYLAGTQIRDVRRLQQIDVTYSGAIVRRYLVGYEANVSSASRSRVSTITECGGSAGDDCLSPLSFTYQNGTNGFAAQNSTGLTASFGRMALDVNGDGLTDVVYASSSTPGAGTWWVAFGNTSGGFNAAVNTGRTNAGFQTIPIDYNADGRDDLMYAVSSGNWQVLLGSNTGLDAPLDTGLSTTGGSVGNALGLDANGDGLDDLVEANDKSVWYWPRQVAGGFGAKTFIINPLGTNSKILLPAFINQNMYRRGRQPDFNGDGHGDFVINISEWNTSILEWIDHAEIVLAGANQRWQLHNDDLTQARYIDLNGDRYTDIVRYDGSNWYYQYSLGSALAGSWTQGPAAANQAWLQALALDWDSDGYQDIVVPNAAGTAWIINRSTALGLEAPVTGPAISGGAQMAFAGDVNGDDLDDAILFNSSNVAQVFAHAGVAPDLLDTVTDGYGNVVNFDYTTLPRGNYTKYADAALPGGPTYYAGYQDYQGALSVVSQYTASDGTSGGATPTYTISYHYYGAWMHRQGRGFSSFYAVRPFDSRTGIADYQYYRRDFPHTGTLIHREPVLNGSISRDVHTLAIFTLGGGAEARYFSYPSESWHYDWEPAGPFINVLLRTVQTTFVRDALSGEIIDQTVITTEKSGANGLYPNATHTVRTWDSTTPLNDTTSNWCIGRSTEKSVTASHSLTYGTAVTRKTSTVWNGSFCRPSTTVVEPGNSTMAVTTDIGYDAFGNVTSQTVTGAGMAARTTWTTWGATGQFPHTLTNALGQQSTKTWNFAFGVPATETDPNGLAISYVVDNFGRKTQETKADNTYTIINRFPCAGCDPRIKTYIRTDLFGVGGAPLRSDYEYFDQQDRTAVTARATVAGNFSSVTTYFDNLGRETYESLPYLTGATVYWVSKYYDGVSRPTQVLRPISSMNSATQSVTTSYEGLTTKTTDEEGKQSWINKNAVGQTVRTVDHDNYRVAFLFDAVGNAKEVVDSNGVTLQSSTYNVRGFKTASTDVDMGSWTYVPNALGEVTSQTDANGKVLSMAYDALGRMTSKSEPAPGGGTITNTWQWGWQASKKDIGQLDYVIRSGSGITTYSEDYEYDSLGRPQVFYYSNGAGGYLTYDYSYNGTTGLLETLTYPTSSSGYRHKIKQEYQYAQLNAVKACTDSACSGVGVTYWSANVEDAFGNIKDENLGNGLRTVRNFDVVSGYLGSIQTGPGGGSSMQNLVYTWDRVGNLKSRQDVALGLTEALTYDNLHRLTNSKLNGTDNLNMAYHPNGNINTRWETGGPTLTYAYHPSKIHAATSVTGTAVSLTYSFDAVGNVTAKNGSAVSWYASNLPQSIANGSYTSTFEYGPDGNYWKQVASYSNGTETTLYVGGLIEKVTKVPTSGTTDTFWRHHIKVKGRTVAIYSRAEVAGTISTIYPLTDHLGGVERITDNVGGLIVRGSFTAWGARRNGATWSGPPSSGPGSDMEKIGNATRRGFTDHTMLDNIGLVHMNGRVYDPAIGRFLSADPHIQAPENTQSWNRYAYVFNNPLSYTDPTGYFSFKKFFKKWLAPVLAIAVAVFMPMAIGAYAASGAFATTLAATGSLASAGMAAMSAYAAASTSLLTAIATGATAGAVAAGSLRGAVQGAFSAGLFFGAGSIGAATGNAAARVVAHAGAGCLSSVAAGGSCGSGAAGSLVSVLTEGVGRTGNGFVDATARGVTGGLGSVAGGGDFGMGFANGVASHAFNDRMHPAPGELLNAAADFAAGAGDVISLGGTGWIRNRFGIGAVDSSSAAYNMGEAAGFATSVATGAGAGLKLAGTAGRGLEFSHWIPNRWGGPMSLWNGNYVTKIQHALSDPYRYRFMPRTWKAVNPMPSALSQQWNRVPWAWRGSAAGSAWGTAGVASAGGD